MKSYKYIRIRNRMRYGILNPPAKVVLARAVRNMVIVGGSVIAVGVWFGFDYVQPLVIWFQSVVPWLS